MRKSKESLFLENQTVFPVYLCAKELYLTSNKLLEPYGLTYTQFLIMTYLWEVGRSSAKEASDSLLLDPSTLTPVLKKLEQKGLITRQRDASDERSLLIDVTKDGAALREQVTGLPDKAALLMGLDNDELRVLRDLTLKILININVEKSNA